MYGGLFALRRHRNERTFDRRAEWYERSFRALSSAASLCRDYLFALSQMRRDPAALKPITAKFEESAVATRLVWDESPMFATELTTPAIRDAAAVMARMAQPSEPITIESTQREVQAVISALSIAMRDLIDEHRAHLGMARFDHESAWSTSKRERELVSAKQR